MVQAAKNEIDSTAARLQEVRSQLDLMALQKELSYAENALEIQQQESLLVESVHGAYIDPATPWKESGWFNNPMGVGYDHLKVDDYDDGDNGLVWRTEEEWRQMHGITRRLKEFNYTAINLLETVSNYVYGKGGLTYDVKVRKDVGNESKHSRLADDIQYVIDRALERNEWSGRHGNNSKSRFIDYRADGERIQVVTRSPVDGLPLLKSIPHGMVTEPDQELARLIQERYDLPPVNFKYGVITDPVDTSIVYGIFVRTGKRDTDFEVIFSQEMLFKKRGTADQVKRGVSDLWAIRDPLMRSAKVLKNTMGGASLHSSIGLLRKLEPGQQGPIKGLGTTRKVEFNHSNGDASTIEVTEDDGVRTYDAKGHDVSFGPMGHNNADSYISTMQSGQTNAGLIFSAPEYISTGVSDDVNHASALSAEAPFIRARQADQTDLAADERALMWMVVEEELKPGGYLWRRYKKLNTAIAKKYISIDVNLPDTSVRDRYKETERYEKLRENSIISNKTWSELEGLDPDQEQERIKEEMGIDNQMLDKGIEEHQHAEDE